jgi:hypothetical protein
MASHWTVAAGVAAAACGSGGGTAGIEVRLH